MTEQNPRPPARRIGRLLAAGAFAAAALWAAGHWGRPTEAAPPPTPPGDGEPTLGGVKLFARWPEGVKPDAVVVLSGQSFGLLQPCGCSRPQYGGLERRFNFMNGLRAKGWPVTGVDLGDIFPSKTVVGTQAEMKYVLTMKALKEMGYVAVGLGKAEFDAGVIRVLGKYAVQNNDPPQILAGNLVGQRGGVIVPRDQEFPRGPGQPPMVGLAAVTEVGKVPVGIAGVVGTSLAKDVEKNQGNAALLGFLGNDVVLKDALKEMAAHKLNPEVRVLLYQGTSEEAGLAARAFPDFPVVLCQSEDPEPPQFPTVITHKDGRKTMVVEVGHKGRYVGVLGVYKTPTGFDYHYQLVPLGEEYLTPDDPAAEKANKVLALLEDYSATVKARDLLGKYPQRPHPNQLKAPAANLAYVGSERCMGCHAAEYAVWKTADAAGHAHSVAFDHLQNLAKRPGQREFDAECVRCHVVGFGYDTGFKDTVKTPGLTHVGCESCHGPGSGHAAAPRQKDLLELMSPWKKGPEDKLPDLATVQKLAGLNPIDRGQVQIPARQQQTVNFVSSMCMHCHDAENDPHFDLFKYWPKVAHSGLNNPGLPPAPGGVRAVPVGRVPPPPGTP